MQLRVLEVLLQYQAIHSWNHDISMSICDQRRSLDLFELIKVGFSGDECENGSQLSLSSRTTQVLLSRLIWELTFMNSLPPCVS